MKKFGLILSMFAVVFRLTACGWVTNSEEWIVNNWNEMSEVNGSFDSSGWQEELADTKNSFDEYQLNFYLISADPEGNEVVMDMDVFHKGDKTLYVINEMPSIPDSPIDTYKTLMLWGDTYVEMWVKWEKSWFKAEGMEETQLDNQFFDLEEMQAELEAEADDVKKEKINGKNMTCYYHTDEEEEGKACTYDGIFAYAESSMLDGSEIETVMEVSDYKKSVKDSVFEKPTDVRDMVELMELMMGG